MSSNINKLYIFICLFNHIDNMFNIIVFNYLITE